MPQVNKDILVYKTESTKEVLKKLDKTAEKTLLVVDRRNKLLGTITDGDVRRYILSAESLENDIKKVYNKKPVYIKKTDFSLDLAKKILIENVLELVPIVDEKYKVVGSISRNQIFSNDKTGTLKKDKINIPIVIMAGGRGARLEPFTKILPKPLIPINDKTVIEILMDEFKKWGPSEYCLTLSHKADMVETYLSNIDKGYKISYIKEKTFSGTAASLRLLEKKIKSDFIVSNCDIIVKADFRDVLNFHKKENALLTILSSIQHYKIPYGVIKFRKKGKVIDIIEKPEYTLTINAGLYVLNKKSLRFIPKKSYFDMTDLIKILIKNNEKVVIYPVNENDYIDIGQWEEYKKAMRLLPRKYEVNS